MRQPTPTSPAPTHPAPEATGPVWTTPRFDVISLDCEITAYAPDGDPPLF